MNEDLKQALLAYHMAAVMNQFQTGFLARISHELRSPLSSIISLHQLILADLCENPEEEREFINQAYQSSLKLMKLIDQIVDVSKLEYGTNILELKPLELKEILTEVYYFVHLQATNKNIKLSINSDTNIRILADEKRLKQILITLIDTGISLMEEGNIQVETKILDDKSLEINLNFDCDNSKWNESVNILETIPENTPDFFKNLSKKIEFSPGMKLLLCQKLMETMGGKLLLISPENNLTRIQIIGKSYS